MLKRILDLCDTSKTRPQPSQIEVPTDDQPTIPETPYDEPIEPDDEPMMPDRRRMMPDDGTEVQTLRSDGKKLSVEECVAIQKQLHG